MFKIFPYGFVLLLSFVLISCNEALQPEPSQLGYEYFPLSSGDFRIYDVTTKDYFTDGTIVSSSYQLKELIGISSITDGQESYRVERYTRTSDAEEWEIDSVWSARINTHQAIMVENNNAIIKLSFPVSEDRRWDGNAMNAKEYDEYKMVDLGFPAEINGFSFDKSVRLVKEDLPDPCHVTEDNIRKELYASGVGMIYYEDIFRNYVSSNKCEDVGVIEFGFEKIYILSDYSVSE